MRLDEAIEQNCIDAVRSMIESVANPIDLNACLDSSPPPLVLAAQLGHAEIVDLLLQAGAHVDVVDSKRRTACHVAATNGRAGVLQLLLAQRPNLSLEDCERKTPLESSFDIINNGTISIMLVDAGAPIEKVRRDLLCELCALSAAAIHELVRRNVEISQIRDREGRTPLHVAACWQQSHDSLALLDLLIDVCGVELEARDTWRNTCTHIAARSGNVIALRRFIQAGANVACTDENGATPVQIARNYESVATLLAAGSEACDQPPEFDVARRDIVVARLGFVRQRAFQICIGLQSLAINALQVCEILVHACGPVAPLIAFHHWWKIVTTVKHFRHNTFKCL
jgi:ankyrin repeat protein